MTTSASKARSTKAAPLCIVGIGASAGGFEAIRDFLTAMPANSGLAFVVVQHLAPNHGSISAELFAKFTSMPVCEATDGLVLQADHVYTAPSDQDITLAGRSFCLLTRDDQGRLHLPIDLFFNSLGEQCGARAIGMVLSGTGSDGALGVKTIAANGGVVLVQKPETAEYEGMPRSAIASGVANYVVPVAQIPQVLVSYAQHPYVASGEGAALLNERGNALRQLIQIIQKRRGYDFSGYKRNTLVRRIERRMSLHGLLTQTEYVDFLQAHPEEVDALFRDLLIGVTEFFRDPAAWKILETEFIVPLVAAKHRDDPIRIWVPGCSTGEEAYTLAMLVLDRVRRTRKACPVQVFATDTNNEALEIGRLGHYPAGVARQISAAHLRRYFRSSPRHQPYTVSEELRRAVVFGTQNLFADPPFGRVDLISCRNVLIYLEPEVQKRVLNMFHFALQRDGFLFLGSAESNGGRDDLFKPVSKKFRIYSRRGSTHIEMLPPPLPAIGAQLGAVVRGSATVPALGLVASVAQRLIMDRFAPAGVMVNDNQEVLYFCGPTDDFLIRPRGAPTHDLLLMVREGLRARLRTALQEAATSNLPVVADGARMKRDGAFLAVQISVTPSRISDADRLYLVVFNVKETCL